MVIVCPECSTKFRVNPERIPAGGTKVRCARCKHVFPVEKPVATEEAPPQITPAEPPKPADEVPPSAQAEASGQQFEDSFDTENSAESSFSYDQFRDLDTTVAEDDDFTFGSEEKSDDTSATAQAATSEEKTPTTDDFDEGDSFSFSTPDTEVPGISADNEEPETVESAAAELDRQADTEEQSPTEPDIPLPAADESKSAPTTRFSRILLLLILGLLIIGGALYFINGPEQIEQVIQQLLGQQTTRQTPSNQISLTNLEGKFINNQDAGELFVIRGEATNNFNEARASIQVKGVIFDQNGKPLLQKTIFCGNPINDQELQTLPFDKLEEMMRYQFGKSLDNMKVKSKEAIPFTIAFRDLPKNLSEFSVDVTASKPATD